VINIGGGITKSFLRQTENVPRTFSNNRFTSQICRQTRRRCTASRRPPAAPVAFDESLVYGKLGRWRPDLLRKLRRHHRIAIIITALSQTAAKYMKGRRRPNFTFWR